MLTLGNLKEIKELASDSNSSLVVLLALDGFVLADIIAARVTQVSLFSSQFFLLPAETKYHVTALTVVALLVSTIVLPIAWWACRFTRSYVESWLSFLPKHSEDSAMSRRISAGRMCVRKDELLGIAVDKGNSIALQLLDRHERDRTHLAKLTTSFFSLLLLLFVSHQLSDAGHATIVHFLWERLGSELRLLVGLVMIWLFWASIQMGGATDDLVYLPESTLVPTTEAKEEARIAAVKELARGRPGDV